MTTLNWIIETVTAHLFSAIFNMCLYAGIAGIIGLILGIYLVRKGGKKGFWERSNSIWSAFVKLNYVFIPVVLFSFFGLMGSILGLHSSTENFIDDATEPIVTYAKGYLPEIQTVVNDISGHSPTNVDQVVSAHLAKNGRSSGGFVNSCIFQFNLWTIEAAIEGMSPAGASAMAEPLMILASTDIHNLDENVFQIIPSTIKGFCAYYFFSAYSWAFFLFLPFLLIPVGEYILYLVFLRLIPAKNVSDEAFYHQSEFV